MEKPDVLSEKEIPVRFISQANHEMIDHRLSRIELFRIAKDEGLIQAQRDADVEWFEREVNRIVNESIGAMLADLKNPETEIHQKILEHITEALLQARQDTARELIEEIEKHGFYFYSVFPNAWQSIKSKFLIPPNPVGSADV